MAKKKPAFTDRDFYVLDSVGITIARKLIDAPTIRRARAIVEAKTHRQRNAKFPMLELDPLFMDLMTHPWIVSGCERVLGTGFRFDHGFGLNQGPGATLANLHGGPLTCQGASFYISAASTKGSCWSGRISVGISLSEQSPASGGMCYIPGSHKSCCTIHGREVLRHQLSERGFSDEAIVVPTLAPGDVTFFVDALVHGATPWKRRTSRMVLYYMYSPGFMAWRPHAETARYSGLARNGLQRRLLRPPYVALIDEGGGNWGDNQWRKPAR